jgi:hypothetical protein
MASLLHLFLPWIMMLKQLSHDKASMLLLDYECTKNTKKQPIPTVALLMEIMAEIIEENKKL